MNYLKILFILTVAGALTLFCSGVSVYWSKPVDQGRKYILVSKIPLEGGSFTTDNLQNIYLWNHSALKKLDSKGKALYNYDDKSYGAISSVDVTDPMKIMVFYKDFPEAVFLDNTLSLNGTPIGTSDLGFPLTTLACISHDNGAWLYETQNQQLVRLDINLAPTQKTGNLMQLLGIPLNPNYLLEYNNYVYLNDSAQGILVFDAFGSYYKTIPVKGLTGFELRGNDLFYVSKGHIYTQYFKTNTEDESVLPDTLAQSARVEKDLLYEDYRDTLRVFEIR